MKLTTLVLTSCLFAACSKQKETTDAPEKETADKTEEVATVTTGEELKPCCSDEAPAAIEVSAESIYQVTSEWQDATGEKRDLKSIGGFVQVVTMGYTTCQYACPRLLADMREIEAKLPEELRNKTHFTFISIDPETDTPARLAEYRKESKIISNRWTVLTGETAAVQELAVVLGVQYRKTTDKDFAHSNIITVLNPNGEIIHRQEGLGSDSSTTVKAITAAHQ